MRASGVSVGLLHTQTISQHMMPTAHSDKKSITIAKTDRGPLSIKTV